MKRQHSSRNGFTLIELMVVVIILAALAGMVVPRLMPVSDEAKSNIARADIATLSNALRMYYLHMGRYPSTEQGLKALTGAPPGGGDWKGPYLEKEPRDPWKREYQYRYPGTHNSLSFDIWSKGPDEQRADDDVTNWEK